MSKHTPGPWRIKQSDSGHWFVVSGGTGNPIAQTLRKVWRTEDEANARLIAAAPDLLAALEKLAQYADTCELFLRETHPGKADALGKRVSCARAAIAKAKGEA